MKKLLFLFLAAMTACSSPKDRTESGSAAFIDETLISAALDSVRAVQTPADPAMLEGRQARGITLEG
jgi:hypothetical protein